MLVPTEAFIATYKLCEFLSEERNEDNIAGSVVKSVSSNRVISTPRREVS